MANQYNISKTSGQCCLCSRELQVGEEFVATVRQDEEDEFVREDFCASCWDSQPDEQAAALLGVWRSRVPSSQTKKKLLVDDELLVSFFERLDGSDDPTKISFRFVLALALMRKKLLVYDGMKKLPDGRDVWNMHIKGGKQSHEVIDPDMDEEKIAEATRHLGQIVRGEL